VVLTRLKMVEAELPLMVLRDSKILLHFDRQLYDQMRYYLHLLPYEKGYAMREMNLPFHLVASFEQLL
jgi:hypothetical protein